MTTPSRFNFLLLFSELTLQNCIELSERGFVHLATLNCLERLDVYRTNIESSALIAILKASPRLKHINLGIFPKTTDELVITLLSENYMSQQLFQDLVVQYQQWMGLQKY